MEQKILLRSITQDSPETEGETDSEDRNTQQCDAECSEPRHCLKLLMGQTIQTAPIFPIAMFGIGRKCNNVYTALSDNVNR